MNNIYKVLFLFPFFILGCKSNVVEESKFVQKIDNLNMNIYSNLGEKIFSINSPSSSFDKEENSFKLKKTTINLFEDKKRKYIINSNESKLTNNNKILELTGNVELRTLSQDNDIMYADIFTWVINDSTYLLTGNVRFENKNITLSSDKATLNQDNIIEFFNPVKYTFKNNNNNNEYEITSENAFYNLTSKSVSFRSKNKKVISKIYF